MHAVNMENKIVPKHMSPVNYQAILLMTDSQIEEWTMENRLLCVSLHMQGTGKKTLVYNHQKLEMYI